ncbi:MAG TPA: flagellin [Candidatus Gastranaerophilales bacterium]|nr:flagellin [Candidatus Gastranaerophilales bacterium]
MSVVVNNNVASLIAQRNLNKNTDNLVRSIERLSSGYRINRSSDDAAGLSISENLQAQIRGNKQAINNIQDGINLLQIAEGGLSVMNDNIQRIRELCVQAANATNGTSEKTAILSEIDARIADIDRISQATRFNSINLLDGSLSNFTLQIGAGAASINTLDLSSVLTKTNASTMGIALNTTGSVWTADNIRSYLNDLDSALNIITGRRSELGAYQNRLESALDNLSIMTENLQSAQSRIRDLDIAEETANMTKYQILQQASASVLAQANRIPQIALSLLQ